MINALGWIAGVVVIVLALWAACRGINFVIDSAERWEE
jgi:hypothetical protein